MPGYTVPEIQRTSLTAVILTLKCLGVHDVIRYVGIHSVSVFFLKVQFFINSLLFLIMNHSLLRFPYLDRPEERFILEALKQLYQFDAIDR